MDAATHLQQLGFGDYEARAYVALLRRSPLNGYELARESGLPRANVYAILQKLEERGAVVRVDAPSGLRYAPVPPGELVDRLGSRFEEALGSARTALEQVAAPTEYETVANVRGYGALIQHARAVVDGAERQLIVALYPPEALALSENLARADERGVDITTLCLEGCSQQCAGCRGRIYRYRVAPDDQARWLVCAPDSREVLAGEIGSGDEALAVRTRQRLLVDLTGWYVQHSIVLAAVLNDLGDRFESLLGSEARSLLATVGPGGRQGGGWIEHMRILLARRPRSARKAGNET